MSILDNKKRIAILAMSCNADFFKRQERLVRETYAADIIDGKYPNIEFWSYSASTDGKVNVNTKLHRIEVPCDDSLKGTMQKTRLAMQCLDIITEKEGYKVDYIFRTNCSTYVNVALLDSFVQQIPNSDLIFSGGIYCTKDASGPIRYAPYGVGNSLLLSRKYIDIVKKDKVIDYAKYDETPGEGTDKSIFTVDDNAIGFMLNVNIINEGGNPFDYWVNFNIPRINTVPSELNGFIAIPYRMYGRNDREQEFTLARLIHEKITKSKKEEYTYKELTTPQIIHIVDFESGQRMIGDKKDALRYLKKKEIGKFIE